MSDPLESTDELIKGNKYVVWGNSEFGNAQMYGYYDRMRTMFEVGCGSENGEAMFVLDKDASICYPFKYWDRTDGNMPRTPQNIPMPEVSPPANQKPGDLIPGQKGLRHASNPPPMPPCAPPKKMSELYEENEVEFERLLNEERSKVKEKSMELYIDYVIKRVGMRNLMNIEQASNISIHASELCDKFEERFGEKNE